MKKTTLLLILIDGIFVTLLTLSSLLSGVLSDAVYYLTVYGESTKFAGIDGVQHLRDCRSGRI